MKKMFLILFSLIMMCSVSLGMEANTIYSASSYQHGTLSSITLAGYTNKQIYNILNSFSNDSSEGNKLALDTLIESLESNNVNYCVYYNDSKAKYYLLTITDGVELCVNTDNRIFLFCNEINSSKIERANLFGTYDNKYSLLYQPADSVLFYHASTDSVPTISSIYSTNIESVCILTYASGWYWDGESYFYKQGGNDSVEVPELTDEQIAEIVERFINSDTYLENAYYNGDYFITYDNLTGYFRGYSYSWNIDLAIEYGNYDEEGNFVTTGTTEGEAWRIRPYEFSGDIFVKFGDWLASKFNTYSFEYFSISPDSSIKPRYIGSLEHNYCTNYKENEVVIYSSKQIRYVGEETNSEGKTETVVTDNYIPPTVLKDSETGEEIIIRDNLQNSSDSLENVITPNADFSGLKQAFEKYISFVNISSITWLTTAISSMITIFVPFVALGIIIFLINRILNGGS